MRNPGQAGLPALKANATTPVIRELVRAGYYQDWPDPCAYHVLANFWKEQALEGFGSTWTEVAQGWAAAPVSSVLFSGAQNADERASMASQAPEAWGTTSPLLPNLGQGTPPSNLNGQAAREQVRAMDAKLNQRRDDLLAQADADAAAWINDLHPFQRYRHDLLVARARLSLLAGNHDTALAHLEMARDVTERSVGHANSGSLFLLMAEAHLDQGRVREALDTLPHLEGHYSHIVGLRESIADLVILRGLDRQGDSKEN